MNLLESTIYLVRAEKFCNFLKKINCEMLEKNIVKLLTNADVPYSSIYCEKENMYTVVFEKSASNLLEYICDQIDNIEFVEAMKVIFKACEF